VAKAIYDDRLIDLPLSPAFWKLLFRRNYSVADLTSIDIAMGSTLIELYNIATRHQVILNDSSLTPEERAARLH
jgi:hypothetical protein